MSFYFNVPNIGLVQVSGGATTTVQSNGKQSVTGFSAFTQNMTPEESDEAVLNARNKYGREIFGDQIDQLEHPSIIRQRANQNRANRFGQGKNSGIGNNMNQLIILATIIAAIMKGEDPQEALKQLAEKMQKQQNPEGQKADETKPTQTQEGQQAQAKKKTKSVKDAENEFTTADADGNDEISLDEFITSYIRGQERKTGKQINKGTPDYLKYEAEAKNIFGSLKERTFWHPFEGRITKERFQQYLNYLDRADGTVDGDIDEGYTTQVIDTIKENGPDVEVSAGKTISELIDMEN